MGQHEISSTSGANGSTFSPVIKTAGVEVLISPQGTGFPQQDTISSASRKRNDGCCFEAHNRVSKWFGELSGFKQFLFLVGCLFFGIPYLVALCCVSDKNNP